MFSTTADTATQSKSQWWVNVSTDPSDLVAQGVLKISALAVWFRLAKYADKTTGTCFPSQATLARETHLTVRTVKRSVKQLEAVGLIVIHSKGAGKFDERRHIYELTGLGFRRSKDRGDRGHESATSSEIGDTRDGDRGHERPIDRGHQSATNLLPEKKPPTTNQENGGGGGKKFSEEELRRGCLDLQQLSIIKTKIKLSPDLEWALAVLLSDAPIQTRGLEDTLRHGTDRRGNPIIAKAKYLQAAVKNLLGEARPEAQALAAQRPSEEDLTRTLEKLKAEWKQQHADDQARQEQERQERDRLNREYEQETQRRIETLTTRERWELELEKTPDFPEAALWGFKWRYAKHQQSLDEVKPLVYEKMPMWGDDDSTRSPSTPAEPQTVEAA